MLCSELMIFIGYKNNSYCFMCYIQGNIIFHSTYTIFDKKLFPKCTNSHTKEHKLYDKLLNKISLEIESLVLSPFGKDELALVFIPHMSISPIQNSSLTCSPSSSLSYKFSVPSFTLGFKKLTVKIIKVVNVGSDIEMQLLSCFADTTRRS